MLCSFIFSGSVFASTSTINPVEFNSKDKVKKYHDHWELIGAPGIAKLHANDGLLGITSSETDRLVQTNASSWNTFAGQLGIGYIHYFHHKKHSAKHSEKQYNLEKYPKHVKWFTAIEPELNLYGLSSNSIKGNVWRFNNSNFNELTYDMPLHSLRLMLDGALTVATWRRLSIYGIGGIGVAWNRIGYSDTDSNVVPCTNQVLNLKSHTSTNFAWEAGIGATLDLNDRFGVSFEYLYTSLGRVATSANGTSGTITTPIISAAHFNLNSQTALLGLHVALGKL